MGIWWFGVYRACNILGVYVGLSVFEVRGVSGLGWGFRVGGSFRVQNLSSCFSFPARFLDRGGVWGWDPGFRVYVGCWCCGFRFSDVDVANVATGKASTVRAKVLTRAREVLCIDPIPKIPQTPNKP